MLTRAPDYDTLYRSFRWDLPARYNIGVDCCDKWAAREPQRLALIHLKGDGGTDDYSFGRLKALTDRAANAFRALGVRRGDRVAILLPQAPETAITHLAAYKLGCIAVPLFTLFGTEALEFRLQNSGAALLVTNQEGAAKVAALADQLPALRNIVTVDGGPRDFHALLGQASEAFTPEDTGPDDPALIVYTSGTTGPPKGALHAHRVLLGHLPGVELPQEFFPQPGDRFWTPADWAWAGGLLDVLLPSLHHGVPVLSHRMAKFDPEYAFRLMARFQVRNAFLPPTALKMLRQVATPPPGVAMRSIGSGGETLGIELLDWGRATFGLTINEFYGQTECNLTVANCASLMPVKPGWMGRPVPGHRVAVIDGEGRVLPPGAPGMIAVHRPDPVMFLGYWNNPEATAKKFIGDWMVTGDQGVTDDEGYLSFFGRDDDVITSGSYRIGPGEIEDCLIRHPAVALAAAVGVPDPLRTERVKAFLVLKPGFAAGEALAREIQDYVKTRLAAHEYPREVAFVEALPMTTTGKIMRRELRRLHLEGKA